MELTGNELFRLISFLRDCDWTDKEIVKLIEYITH